MVITHKNNLGKFQLHTQFKGRKDNKFFQYSWLTSKNYHVTWRFWNPCFQNLANLGHYFLREKSFVQVETMFFRSKFGKKIANKRIVG
jgi:hypothetical protein